MVTPVILFFTFIFGTIVGSFLNVVILRYGSGRDLSGRSGCFSCGAPIHWFDLVPVFSYLALGGHCRSCRSSISIQYPLVELATGCIFVLLVTRVTHPLSLLLSAIIWSSLIVIFVYDLRHKIIPDMFSGLFGISAALLTLFNTWQVHDVTLVTSHFIAALCLSGFFYLLWLISKGKWMGFGDVKLAFGIGLYLGLPIGLSAIAFAFWTGAVFAIFLLVLSKLGTWRLSSRSKALTMKSEVPFAPFLIIGIALAYAMGSDVFHLSLLIHG